MDAAGRAQGAGCDYLLAAATGLAGTGFHFYNVGKKVGGFSWQNAFYGAPLGAPMAILLSGLLGFCSERVRESDRGRPQMFGLPAGRTVAAVAGAGLLGTAGEAGLLHFRGAYHDPFMVVPVTMPPIGAALLMSAARRPPRQAASAHPLVDVAPRRHGPRRRRFPRLRRVAQYGRLAQLEPEHPERTAASCTAELAGLALAGLAALGLIEDHPDA